MHFIFNLCCIASSQIDRYPLLFFLQYMATQTKVKGLQSYSHCYAFPCCGSCKQERYLTKNVYNTVIQQNCNLFLSRSSISTCLVGKSRIIHFKHFFFVDKLFTERKNHVEIVNSTRCCPPSAPPSLIIIVKA